MNKKIVVIEDDRTLRKYISEYLSAYDFDIEAITSFDNVLVQVEAAQPDLILLDINLPVFDGFYYLKMIRKQSTTPVIILSARSDEGEQIRGMSMGADDYITKPFSVGILVAKINAVLRRAQGNEQKDLEVGPFSLCNESMKLTYRDTTLELSKNEYRILAVLAAKANTIVTREELLEALWDDTVFVDDNTLTVNMTRVKKKLRDIGICDVITTKRGVGYVLSTTDL